MRNLHIIKKILPLLFVLGLAYLLSTLPLPIEGTLKAKLLPVDPHEQIHTSCEKMTYHFPLTLCFEKARCQLPHGTYTTSQGSLTFSLRQLFEKSWVLQNLELKDLAWTPSPSNSGKPKRLASPPSLISSLPRVRIQQAHLHFAKGWVPEDFETCTLKGLHLSPQRIITRIHTPASHQSYSLALQLLKGHANLQVGYSRPIGHQFLCFHSSFSLSQRNFARLFKNPYHALEKLKGSYELESFSLFNKPVKLSSGSIACQSDKKSEIQLAFKPKKKGIIAFEGQLTLKNLQGKGHISLTAQTTEKHPFLSLPPLKGSVDLSLFPEKWGLEIKLKEAKQPLASLAIDYVLNEQTQQLKLQNFSLPQIYLHHLTAQYDKKGFLNLEGRGESLATLPFGKSPELSFKLKGNWQQKNKVLTLNSFSGGIFGLDFFSSQNIEVQKTGSSYVTGPLMLQTGGGLLKSSSIHYLFKEQKLSGILFFEGLRLPPNGLLTGELNGKIQLQDSELITKKFLLKQVGQEGSLSLEGKLFSLSSSSDTSLRLFFDNYPLNFGPKQLAKVQGKALINRKGKQPYALLGSLEIKDAHYQLSETPGYTLPTFKTHRPQVEPQEKKLAPIAFVNCDLAFKVKKLRLEGRGVFSDWKGKLTLKGPVNDPTWKGFLALEDGFFMMGKQKVELNRGNLTLDSAHPSKGEVDLTLHSPLPRPMTLHVHGPFDRLKFQHAAVNSIPDDVENLFNPEILGDSSNYDTAQLSQLGLFWLKNSQLPGKGMWSKFSQAFDTLSLEPRSLGEESEQEWTFRVGKFLTKTLFIAVGKDFREDSFKVELDLQLSKHLFLEAGSGSDSEPGQLALKWKYRY